MRPRLRIQSTLPPEQAIERLREAVHRQNPGVTGTFSGRYVVLRIGDSNFSRSP